MPAALLRMTPDPDAQLELNADANGLDREWLDPKLNDFDDHALEEAVLLKEATSGSVIAVAIGEGSNRTLQMAIARGHVRDLHRMAPRSDDNNAGDRSHRRRFGAQSRRRRCNDRRADIRGPAGSGRVVPGRNAWVGACLWHEPRRRERRRDAHRFARTGKRDRRQVSARAAGCPRGSDRQQTAALCVRNETARSRQEPNPLRSGMHAPCFQSPN